VLRRFDGVVAVSASVEQRLRSAGVRPAIIHQLTNAFASDGKRLSRKDARRVLDLPDVPVIGWVGRLSIEKGPDVALETLAHIGRDDVRLVVIGDGPNAEALRKRAVTLGVSEQIDWRGAIPDASRVFEAFDVFLLSSRTEGTPIALFEAMAAEVPVVATRVGGVPAIVDEASAYLVDTEDAVGMGRAIADILANPERGRARAGRARSRLDEKFGMSVWLSAHEQLYRSACLARRNRAAGARGIPRRRERRAAPLASSL
jgi:glycosyltransferase involved in cell wall biosynthesis